MRNSKIYTKKVKDNSTYTASFTAASLLLNEFLNMEEILCAKDFDGLMEQEVKNNEFLGIKTEAGRKRVVQEIRKRHENAPKDFWEMFFNAEEAEQKLALFYLCLKTYPLVMDFHLEVTLRKWKSKSLKLDAIDLQMRLDEIASIEDEVMEWSEQTQRKTITVYKRMLTEAGLLKRNELQKSRNINSDFWNYFIELGESWLIEACFYNRNQILKLDE
jgi:hypothetical protein